MRLYHIWRRFWTIIVQIFFPYKLEDFLHHRYCSVCFTTTDIARNEAKYTLKKILRTRTQYKEFAETGLTSCRMSNFLIVVWGRSSQGRLGYNTPHKDHRIYVAVLWRTSSASDITWEYCFLFCFFSFFLQFFPLMETASGRNAYSFFEIAMWSHWSIKTLFFVCFF